MIHPNVALNALRSALDNYMTLMPQIRRAFSIAPTLYESLSADCRAGVVRREWSRNPRHQLEPFYFELGDCRRGRPVKKEPALLLGWHEYGFDADGRLIQEREYTELPGRYYEEFFTMHSGFTEAIRYDYSSAKEPICVERLHGRDGSLSCYLQWAPAGQSTNVYWHEDDTLRWFLTFHETFGGRSFGGFGEVIYGPDGEVDQIYHLLPNGSRSVAYERKRKRSFENCS